MERALNSACAFFVRHSGLDVQCKAIHAHTCTCMYHCAEGFALLCFCSVVIYMYMYICMPSTHFFLVVVLKDDGIMQGVIQVICWLLLSVQVVEMVAGDCMVEEGCSST